MLRVEDGLELLHGVLDLPERHLSVDEVVQDAPQAPHVALVVDFDGNALLCALILILQQVSISEFRSGDNDV